MSDSPQITPAPSSSSQDVRNLQAKLYREIGISAVAAALHSISQPEPGKRPAEAATVACAPVGWSSRAA